MKKGIIGAIIVGMISVVLMGLVVRGDKGGPLYFQYEKDTSVLGPFESSNNTSRYALTESIVENNTIFFSDELARFSAPDLVYYKEKFFSIFTPGVSFIGVPFYMIGNLFGAPQLMTYLSTSLLAIGSGLLIASLAVMMGSSLSAGFLAGIVYLFGTHALPYAVTFTQHQASAFLILLGLVIAKGKGSLVRALLLGSVYGIGILVDIPNAFLLLPLMLFSISRYIFMDKKNEKSVLRIKLVGIAVVIGMLPFLGVFAWYNSSLTGSVAKLGQFIGRSNYPPEESIPGEQERDLAAGILPFHTRIQLNGLYILLTSDERGWLYFSPVIVIGLLGLVQAFKRSQEKGWVLTAFGIIVMNIILYSMFGDPWGGWSFGPRYLIPATAVASIGIGVAVALYARNIIFFILFAILTLYSVRLSTLGVLTTNTVPPKQEAEHLVTPIPYTYAYNESFISDDKTSSLFYNFVLKGYVPVRTYHYALMGMILTVIAGLYIAALGKKAVKKGAA